MTDIIETNIKGARQRCHCSCVCYAICLPTASMPSLLYLSLPLPPRYILCMPGDMTVILCVLQATVDFSTAAAIKLARKHDPAGERTMVRASGVTGLALLGDQCCWVVRDGPALPCTHHHHTHVCMPSAQCVVTKIDLTELGQDMLNCLQGGASALKLKMGLIPVRAMLECRRVGSCPAGQRTACVTQHQAWLPSPHTTEIILPCCATTGAQPHCKGAGRRHAPGRSARQRGGLFQQPSPAKAPAQGPTRHPVACGGAGARADAVHRQVPAGRQEAGGVRGTGGYLLAAHVYTRGQQARTAGHSWVQPLGGRCNPNTLAVAVAARCARSWTSIERS